MRVRWAFVAGIVIACSSTLVIAKDARGADVGGVPAARRITKMPRLVTRIDAEYPPAKKAAGVEATVVLTIEIGATGAIARVAVAEGAAPDFDAAAVAAAQRLVFEPAEVDGKPAPATITFRYSFVVAKDTPTLVVPVPAVSAPGPPPAPLSPPAPDPAADVRVVGKPRERHEAVQTTVAAQEGRRVAGTQGDVLKVVHNLPGVSRPPVASGQIVVWGSAPKETRVYVDGVEIPALFHGSGLRSIMTSDLVAGVDLVPGAFGPEYGRGLGGLVRVETRSLPRGTHGHVAVDTLDASAMLSVTLGSRTRIAVALRQSYLDRLVALTGADVGDTFPIPRYRDGQIKATVDLRRGESIDFVALGSTDAVARSVPSVDPASTKREDSFSGFWRTYARYSNVGDDRAVVVTPFFGRDTTELRPSFGGAPTRLDVDAYRYGLRASSRSRIGPAFGFTLGLDVLGTSASVDREGSLTLPPREGDIAVFGQPPGDERAADSYRTSVVDLGPSVQADVRLGPFTLSPGARIDAFLVEGSRKTPRVGVTPGTGFSRLETALAPRMSARWQVAPRLSFTGSYGHYHQPPEPEELSAVFGTPDLALSRATHVTFGESFRITPSLALDVVGFHKTMSDLVVRSRLTNPLSARVLTQNGEGRSYGVQLLVRQEMWRGFFGWVSYAVSRSERRNEGDAAWRAFDFDQPHVLSIVGSQEIGHFTFGARFRVASGNSRTPVTGSSYDARADRYDPVFGAQGSIRIPTFWQLDLRIDRTFALGERARLVLYADVQNVTNRQNAEEIVYSPSFRERKAIAGIPTLAVVGARVEL